MQHLCVQFLEWAIASPLWYICHYSLYCMKRIRLYRYPIKNRIQFMPPLATVVNVEVVYNTTLRGICLLKRSTYLQLYQTLFPGKVSQIQQFI